MKLSKMYSGNDPETKHFIKHVEHINERLTQFFASLLMIALIIVIDIFYSHKSIKKTRF